MTTSSTTTTPTTEKTAASPKPSDGIHRSKALFDLAFTQTLRPKRQEQHLVPFVGALFTKTKINMPVSPGRYLTGKEKADRATVVREAWVAMVDGKRLIWSYKGEPPTTPITVFVPSELLDRNKRFLEERPAFPDPATMGVTADEPFVEVRAILKEEEFVERETKRDAQGKKVEKEYKRKRLIGFAMEGHSGLYVFAPADKDYPTNSLQTWLCTRRAGGLEVYGLKPKDKKLQAQGPFQFVHNGQLYDALHLLKLDLRALEQMSAEKLSTHVHEATQALEAAFATYVKPLERAKGVKFDKWTEAEQAEIFSKNFQRLPVLRRSVSIVSDWHAAHRAKHPETDAAPAQPAQKTVTTAPKSAAVSAPAAKPAATSKKASVAEKPKKA